MAEVDPELTLDDQLCFALYAASRAMTACYRPLLDRLDLTYPQYLVMLVLWDEGPSTVSHLGERLRLDSGTLSPLLRRLEKHGLVTRSRRADDERSVVIDPTERGRGLRERADEVPRQIRGRLQGIDTDALRDDLRRLETLLREE